MKREIKFRAWDGKMIPPEGVTIWNGKHWDAFRDCEIIGTILMQFTGLHDKNGKEIYEGDILKYSDGSDVSHHEILWDNELARWWDRRLEDGDSNTHYYEFEFVTDCEVIGNIYQNPDLLK